DAGGGIDELRDDFQVAKLRLRAPDARGRLPDLQAVGNHVTPAPAFSSLTRNVLNSGVQVFGSIAEGVRKFASGPMWFESPSYPQCSGNPMCHTGFPSTTSGFRRPVTMATPSIEPRAEVTRAREPLVMPFSFASCSGISMKNP